MNNILFNYDNKFFEILGKITDIIILNLLLIIFCIPIITIGASVSSAYSVGMKMIKNKEAYITKEFLKQFKMNFKECIIIECIFLGIGILIGVDFYISKLIYNQYMNMSLQFIFNIMGIIFIFAVSYVFAIVAKFNNTIKNTIINSILMPIKDLPYTIIIIVVNFSPLLLIYWGSNYWAQLIFFYIVIGFGINIYVNSIFFNKIFNKYI